MPAARLSTNVIWNAQIRSSHARPRNSITIVAATAYTTRHASTEVDEQQPAREQVERDEQRRGTARSCEARRP